MVGGRLRPVIFPALAGLLRHPDEGAVLFDTGYDRAFLQATAPFPERLYRWLTPPAISDETSVRAQLARFGLAPSDIRYVMLSHFHADHIAGLHAFPEARILCSRQGLAAARHGGHWTALRGGVLRALLPPDLDRRVRFFEECPLVPLPAAFRPFLMGADLFGDGALLAIELPGHCPGHWGLIARAEDERLHFLAADAAWSSCAIRESRPPPRLTTALLGRTAPYRATLAQLHRMSVDAPEILITPSHCAERAAAIRTSPSP